MAAARADRGLTTSTPLVMWVLSFTRYIAGEIGQVIISSCDPGLVPEDYIKHSGGIFRDMTIHHLDIGRWLLG